MRDLARTVGWTMRAAVAIAGCGAPAGPPATARPFQVSVDAPPAAGRAGATAEPPAAPERAGPGTPGSEPQLAAIQKAMNELDEAAQQCWAAAATERFDIEGEIALQIDVAAERSAAQIVRDTAHNARLAACLVQLMAAYRWAPPLFGQTIQLPFKFRATDGQNTVDRTLVAWNGQARVSVAVLLDENSTGNDAASMFELAIAQGGTTGVRRADRAELWYFLGDGEVSWPAGGRHAVAAGDMLYVPRGGARAIAAPSGSLHAMLVMVPGGREGAARGGALPTPELPAGVHPATPVVLPASRARTYGPAMIYADAAVIPDRSLAASLLAVPAGGRVAEHVHASETEMLYLLAGAGTLTVNGTALPITATSVVQIPRNTRHGFVATSDVRAVQIYTPAGPEQRFKAHP